MGAYRRKGQTVNRARLEVRMSPKLIDLITVAADRLHKKGVSEYVRAAIVEKLTRDGYRVPGDGKP